MNILSIHRYRNSLLCMHKHKYGKQRHRQTKNKDIKKSTLIFCPYIGIEIHCLACRSTNMANRGTDKQQTRFLCMHSHTPLLVRCKLFFADSILLSFLALSLSLPIPLLLRLTYLAPLSIMSNACFASVKQAHH